MKIAVIGGAGFIGSHVVNTYLEAGHDVFVVDTLINGTRQTLDRRARFYQLDLRDPQLRALLQAERPEIVSHHAAQREQRDLPAEQSLLDADIQVRGLLNVLDSCVSASVEKIIFASGGNDLYDRPESLPLTENAALCPRQPQEISKQAAEWYIRYYTRQYGLTHTIFRYADVYGETEREHLHHPLSYIIRMLLEERRPTIRRSADELRDHIFIDDVARANLCALERGHNQTFNISTGEGHTLSQFYQIVAATLNSDIEPVYITNSLVFGLPPRPNAITLDNSLAKQHLGWRPQVSFAQGIQATIDRISERMGIRVPVVVEQSEMVAVGV
jgi:UDP-glucose 4-epimerase